MENFKSCTYPESGGSVSTIVWSTDPFEVYLTVGEGGTVSSVILTVHEARAIAASINDASNVADTSPNEPGGGT